MHIEIRVASKVIFIISQMHNICERVEWSVYVSFRICWKMGHVSNDKNWNLAAAYVLRLTSEHQPPQISNRIPSKTHRGWSEETTWAFGLLEMTAYCPLRGVRENKNQYTQLESIYLQ